MTVRHSRQLVVVGGGVAGVAAALAAQRAGLETCLVDRRAVGDVDGIEVWPETVAWGIWGHDLALWGPRGENAVVAADQVILATGAHDRPGCVSRLDSAWCAAGWRGLR